MTNPKHLTAAELRERDKGLTKEDYLKRAHESYERYVEYAESHGVAPKVDRETYVSEYMVSLPASLVRG